jgi:hypothetical protein
MDEFECEPIRGLPELLPEGETILWQGSPSWTGLARRVFHVRKVALYFGLILAWSVGAGLVEGASPTELVGSVAWGVAPASMAMGLLALFAWLNGRTTVYTLTSRRIVMRFGVAFQLSVNLPFNRIESVAIRRHGDGTADIPLRVSGAEGLGYLMLWPHARPWRLGRRVEPMLRCVPEAETVAEALADALAGSMPRAAARREEVAARAAEAPVRVRSALPTTASATS